MSKISRTTSACAGVLVAISIPIFSSQLEKSRDAVTLSNIRAAYVEAQSAYLTQESDTSNGVTYKAGDNGAATVEVANVEAKGTKEGLANSGNLPFGADKLVTAMRGKPGKYTITFTYDTDGKITDATAA